MAINKYFTNESLGLFVDKIKEYTDNEISTISTHEELTNEQIDAILGPLDGGSSDSGGDTSSGGSSSTTDIELDGTLTQSGMAADAKVVGDRLAIKADKNHTHEFSVSNIPNLQSVLDGKASASHTHNYAGSSTSGGAATSANKLNTDAGSSTQPVYFVNGIPVSTTYKLESSVPSNAKFTDTTYSIATQSSQGLMSAEDKIKLDGIESNTSKITVDFELSSTSENPVQNKVIYTALNSKVPTTRTINGKSLSSNITLSASDVGAEVSGAANTALTNAKKYTDDSISVINEELSSTVKTINGTSPDDNGNITIDAIGGKDGEDGITPHIGSNGNWFIGTTDTGKPSRGETGLQGQTGAAAGFGTPTATVDANVGTPSVTVTASGSNAAKVFNFVFKNLKGEKGEKGEDAPINTFEFVNGDHIGEVGTPTVTVSEIPNAYGGTTYSIDFNYLKGESGYTPVKGTDYWTVSDKLAMVQDVLAAITNGDEVSY